MKKFRENINWFWREVGLMYSTKPSFFSKKRIESGLAFIIAQWGMIFYFLEHHTTMDMTSMLMWTGTEFAISGYMLNHIQKEKKNEVNEEPEEN
jgi:hypothetical protein